jgi:segregation and condensation protein B
VTNGNQPKDGEDGGTGNNGDGVGDEHKPADFSDDETTSAFADNEPTRASRPPVPREDLPPGDLPPGTLGAGLEGGLDGAFDVTADDSGELPLDPLTGPMPGPEDEPTTLMVDAAEALRAADGAEALHEIDPSDLLPEEPAQPSEAEQAAAATPEQRLESIVESLLFASDKPLTLKTLGELLGEIDLVKLREVVSAVEQHYLGGRGMQLHGVAGGYQFRTNPENARWVQKLLAQKPVRLSRAQLETLAIVAYRQPITRPEIDEIRGVDSGGTLKTLLDRSLIRILGKKEEPGRPMLYGTTKDFLEFFNLPDLKDLPTLREFHELSEEHQAQVAALESAAPEGSIESAEEARVAAEALRKPLERMTLTAPPEDAQELEEIDQLIQSAGQVAAAVTRADEAQAESDAKSESSEHPSDPEEG